MLPLHNLSKARNLADQYRYTGDIPQKTVGCRSHTGRQTQKMLSLNGLQISQAITPKLYNGLEKACENLNVPVQRVSAYVTSSAQLQAQCFESDDDNCIINISSGLVNLLNIDEIMVLYE
jgi:hypothetical protein